MVEFLRDLKDAPWLGIDFRSSSPDRSLETFLKIVTTVIDKHLPLVTKRIKRQMQPEWMNLDILEAIKNRYGAKKHHNDNLYKVWRNKVTSLIREAKSGLYSEAIELHKNNPQKLSKVVQELMNQNKCSMVPNSLTFQNHTFTKEMDVAHAFNKHFTSVC